MAERSPYDYLVVWLKEALTTISSVAERSPYEYLVAWLKEALTII